LRFLSNKTQISSFSTTDLLLKDLSGMMTTDRVSKIVKLSVSVFVSRESILGTISSIKNDIDQTKKKTKTSKI